MNQITSPHAEQRCLHHQQIGNLPGLFSRQPGISPDLASFLWLMLHDLLSTQARLRRMGEARSEFCKRQGCEEICTLEHELLNCSKNDGVGNLFVSRLQDCVPGLQPFGILRLEFSNPSEYLCLAITWLTAIILHFIWKERETGSTIQAYKERAELEQYINLLRTTRLKTDSNLLNNFKMSMFY